MKSWALGCHFRHSGHLAAPLFFAESQLSQGSNRAKETYLEDSVKRQELLTFLRNKRNSYYYAGCLGG